MNSRAYLVLLVLVSSLFARLGVASPGPKAGGENEYSHRTWRMEDGLPQNRIGAIGQTPDGYLWIGTTEGLARFDGARFTVFDGSNTPALHDDSIIALRLGADGSLWIGTEGGGLVRMFQGVFRSFGAQQGLTNGFVRAIYEDRDKNLFIGTDRGLFRRAGDRFVRLDGTPEIPLASVQSMAQDSGGQLWISTAAALLTLKAGTLSRVPCSGGTVRGLQQTRSGTVWALHARGASRLPGCAPDPAMPNLSIAALREDSEGDLWIGTVGHGLLRKRSGELSSWMAGDILPGNTVTAIFEDTEQNVWVGCQEGLLRLSRSSVNTIGSTQGLDDDNVSTVYEDRKGDLWLATLTGQIYQVSGRRARRYFLPQPATDLPVRTVFEDSGGALWFGTSGSGVIRLAGNKALVYSTEEGLRSKTVRHVQQDKSGAIWLALDSGFSRWDGARFRNYYLEDGLSYPSTRCLAIDRNGDILVGTDAGLNRVHEGQIVRDPVFAKVSQEKVWAIYQQDNGDLWLGTRGGGLLRIRSGAVWRITTRQGLPSNSIYQILGDTNGKLWVSTPSGIFSLTLNELEAVGRNDAGAVAAMPYGTADDLKTSQMNGGFQPAGCKTISGLLSFPGVKGLVQVDPLQPPRGRLAPAFIERVAVDDRPQTMGATLTIPPGRSKLEIDFTAPQLTAPQRVKFQYKLEGFDNDWTTPAKARSASYTDLPPGNYRFRVVASDAAWPTRTSEASVGLVLRPFFYQTAWFYSLAALAVAACVWGVFLLYARQTRFRYAVQLSERTRLAREMHDTVIQGCVGISTLLDAVSRLKSSDAAQATELLDEARIQTKATLEEARQAVWDLRNESAAGSSIASLFDLARKVGSEHRVRVETSLEGKAALDPGIDRTLLLVGREAVRNAVAHAAPSLISVHIAIKDAEVRLEVRDNGRGFASSSFARGKDGHFGIVGMRERIEQLGGSFSLESEPGAGTTVLARVPLRERAIGAER